MPKVIVNSGYVKNVTHFTNYIEYSGNKLEAQSLIMNDGSIQEMQADAFIDITNDALVQDVSAIRITFKDGITRDISINTYTEYSKGTQTKISESVLVGVGGETIRPLDSPTYLEYMGHRPSVGKNAGESHGLFDMDGTADMSKAVQTAHEYPDHVKWSHIISLTREDAERTGFDNRKSWETLIRSKAYDIAKVYNISPENLVLYGAYHDKAHHPHAHLFFYSKNRREGFVKGGTEALTKASDRLRSMFLNSIFTDDVSHLKDRKQTQEQQLKQELQEITRQIGHKRYTPNQGICNQFQALADSLQDYSGRPYYGYLSGEQKHQVNALLKKIVTEDKQIHTVFSRYLSTQKDFISQYTDNPDKIEKRLETFTNHFFNPDKGGNRSFHNLIVQHALRYNQNRPTSPTTAQNDTTQQEPHFSKEQQINPLELDLESVSNSEYISTDVRKKENMTAAIPLQQQNTYGVKQNNRKLSYATNSLLYSVCRLMARQAVQDFSFSNNTKSLQKGKRQKQKIQLKPRQKKKVNRFTPSQSIEY